MVEGRRPGVTIEIVCSMTLECSSNRLLVVRSAFDNDRRDRCLGRGADHVEFVQNEPPGAFQSQRVVVVNYILQVLRHEPELRLVLARREIGGFHWRQGINHSF